MHIFISSISISKTVIPSTGQQVIRLEHDDGEMVEVSHPDTMADLERTLKDFMDRHI